MPKQINQGLKLKHNELVVLRQFFNHINTTQKNIYKLFTDQGEEYAQRFIDLCKQSIEQGYIVDDLHEIIKDSNFQILFGDFRNKIRSSDVVSQTLFDELYSIVDRLSKQLPGLTIVGNIDLNDHIARKNKKQLNAIANQMKDAKIAHNVYDDPNGTQETKIIQNIICSVLDKKQWKQAYNQICDMLYGSSDTHRGDTPANWNVFVQDIYAKSTVSMPSKDALHINFAHDEMVRSLTIGDNMTRERFLKVQNLNEDGVNIGDDVWGWYTGTTRNFKGKAFFSIGSSHDIAIPIDYLPDRFKPEQGTIYQIHIKTKIANRDTESQKKYLFTGELVNNNT